MCLIWKNLVLLCIHWTLTLEMKKKNSSIYKFSWKFISSSSIHPWLWPTLTLYFQLSLHQHTKKVHETDLVRTERHKNSTKEKVTKKKKAREKNSVIESRKRWKNYLSCCVFLLCFYCRAKNAELIFSSIRQCSKLYAS